TSLIVLKQALNNLASGFSHLEDFTESADNTDIEKILLHVSQRLHNNYPYFHPLYAGQMLKPPHPIARLAYMLSMWINPNNHALDGGKESSAMEKEAVKGIAAMFGWKEFLGHLTGGGTMANMEALWISSLEKSGKTILVSEQAHYTHQRISEVLGLKYDLIPCDSAARMDIDYLRKRLTKGDVGTLVATIGTTGTGSVDPLPQIIELKEQYDFRLHADAAYGGYFILTENLDSETQEVYNSLSQVDSIVIDPHKHGLQPYGCGCILYKNPGVGKHYQHSSPYTYFTSDELHLGKISLECSRAGASAVALWATQKLFLLQKGGIFARNLTKSLKAARELYKRLDEDNRFRTIMAPELDIVVWAMEGGSSSDISEASQVFFNRAAEKNLHLALFKYPVSLLEKKWQDVHFDTPQVTCVRSCLMKPEHLDWIDRIWKIIDTIA
ncbi:MAG: aminotransferase class V-fold PLP-dependent enzyme, partial [bacterium]